MKVTFIEHACFLLEHGGKTAVIDPFTSNLGATLRAHPKFLHPDFVLLTHGHDDHTKDLMSIIGASTTVIAIVETAGILARKGIKNAFGMNFGGTAKFGEWEFSLVPAVHSSSENGVYYGEPGGFIVKCGDFVGYHAGDTDVFGDMKLIHEFYRPKIGFLPIGGRYTMDAKKAAYACNNFFSFDAVVPMHYGTFPAIRADVNEFVSLVDGKVVVLSPNESADFD